MKAMAAVSFGTPDVIQYVDLPKPEIGIRDVLIEVRATSVNPVDVKTRQGSRFARQFPWVQGFDVSGVIVELGPDAHGFSVGDEVFASPHLMRQGANAEYVAVDCRTVAHKPRSLDFATAAALPLAGITAWESLHTKAHIEPGSTVFITAGAGGVGHLEIQLAKLHGCRVIATAGREESIAFCRDVLKADEVINYRTENVVERVKALTGDSGLHYLFDNAGGDTFEQCLDAVAVNGHIVTILGDDSENIPGKLFTKSASLHFEFMGASTVFDVNPGTQAHTLQILSNLVDAGLLQPHVSHVFSLNDLARAHEQVETGHTVGKVVVQVS